MQGARIGLRPLKREMPEKHRLPFPQGPVITDYKIIMLAPPLDLLDTTHAPPDLACLVRLIG